MTKLKFNIIVLLFLGIGTTLMASEPLLKKEITREIHETFQVSPGSKLGVQNKYGNVNITTWDKNQVQIDVLIKVKSTNVEKAQKFIDAIEIAFDASTDRVMAKTVYPDSNKHGSWWSSWWGNSKNIDYEVHYDIKAPVQINTKLINKYGNINQASIDGSSDVTNKYGDIFFDNVSGDVTMDLGYGKAKMGELGNANFTIKYSDIKLISAAAMETSTKYSDVQIKNCASLVSKTKYDDYIIGTAGSIQNTGKYDDWKVGVVDKFKISTKYSGIEIKSLNHTGVFNTGYGGVRIETVSSGAEKISIESKYTSYKLGDVSSFHVDFDGAYADLILPDAAEKYARNKDGSDLKVKAFRGSKSAGTQIIAKMRYGSLKIY